MIVLTWVLPTCHCTIPVAPITWIVIQCIQTFESMFHLKCQYWLTLLHTLTLCFQVFLYVFHHNYDFLVLFVCINFWKGIRSKFQNSMSFLEFGKFVKFLMSVNMVRRYWRYVTLLRSHPNKFSVEIHCKLHTQMVLFNLLL